MAVERWRNDKGVGTRLAAHRLTGLLSIDLEGSETIGAIRTDRSTTFTWRGDSDGLPAALAALNGFSEGASYLVGHNVIEHDLELLAKHAPDLKLLDLATIDTLYLSPLVYPENPYHHLVKQYQEPTLARVQVNDPLRDLGSRRAEAPAIPQTSAGRRWVPTRLNHVTTPQDDLRHGCATRSIFEEISSASRRTVPRLSRCYGVLFSTISKLGQTRLIFSCQFA